MHDPRRRRVEEVAVDRQFPKENEDRHDRRDGLRRPVHRLTADEPRDRIGDEPETEQERDDHRRRDMPAGARVRQPEGQNKQRRDRCDGLRQPVHRPAAGEPCDRTGEEPEHEQPGDRPQRPGRPETVRQRPEEHEQRRDRGDGLRVGARDRPAASRRRLGAHDRHPKTAHDIIFPIRRPRRTNPRLIVRGRCISEDRGSGHGC